MLTFCRRRHSAKPSHSVVDFPLLRPPLAWILAFLAGLVLLFFQSVPAQAEPVRVDSVQAELIADLAVVRPGSPVRVGLRLIHDEGWHTYWRNPGDSGLPTQFPLESTGGLAAGEIQWPLPSRLLIPPLANLGFEGEVLLVRQLQVPADYGQSTLEFSTLAQWLVCREVCIPGEARLTLSLPVAAESVVAAQSVAFDAAAKRLPVRTEAADFSLSPSAVRWFLPASVIGESYRPGQPDATRLEYFAYAGGVVSHAAPQKLSWLDDQQVWQLDIPLEPVLPGEVASLPTASQLDGVIVINGEQGLELRGRAALTAKSDTQAIPVATVEGHVLPLFEQQNAASSLLEAAGSGRGGGLAGQLSGLVGAAGSVGGAASSGALVPPAAAPAVSGDAALQSLWVALVFAAVGGLILNLMPCVFPVIGLKILGFAGSGAGGGDLTPAARRQVRQGSLWFAAGVLVSFVALSGVLLALRSAGESIGWGFQLQSPVFVVLMALLFVAIGLNFSGVYEFGTSLTRLGNLQSTAPDRNSHGALSAFGAGVLAVLVATPCTAPFMGSALGFTLTQSPVVTLLIFTALGLGMALPYLALGFAPGWLRWLPRPGRWMESLRQFMAFPMYAAAAWLAWVLGLQAGLDALLALAIGSIVLALGLWTWGRHVQSNTSGGKPLAALISVALFAGALFMAWPQTAPQKLGAQAKLDWQQWSVGGVTQALAAGRPVFIDFTAAWCISCQVNKRLVLQSGEVVAAFRQHNVVAMRADWTQRDPAITAELARHGRNAVPLYLLYKPGASAPQVLPELLRNRVVLDALSGQ